MSFSLYCSLQELQNMPEDSNYLFHNYPWKHHPSYDHCMELQFSDDAYTEAAAIYHELWHIRFDLPSLKRSWF